LTHFAIGIGLNNIYTKFSYWLISFGFLYFLEISRFLFIRKKVSRKAGDTVVQHLMFIEHWLLIWFIK
jgi:bacteriorhodopsin